MAHFDLIARHPLGIDGQVIPAGQVVATIITNLEISAVISSTYFGDLQAKQSGEPGKPMAPPPDDVKRVRRDRKQDPEPQPPALDDSPVAIDPDELNAEPDEQPEPEPEQLPERIWWEGLPERIGSALSDAGFTSREAIKAHLQKVGTFADVDGIGKAAEKKIVQWLEQ
jgi:hypothetical protein